MVGNFEARYQKCILFVPEKIWCFFSKKNCFIVGPWAKSFRLSVKMLFGGLVKTAFSLSRKNLFFSEKKYYSSHFRCFTNLFSAFYSKISSKFVRTAFFVSRGTSCGFFAKKTLSVLDFNWNIISSMANFSWQAWQNWILSVHENFLKVFDSAKKTFFFMFSGHRAKPWRRSKEIFSAGLSKQHLRVPEKHFDWTHSLKKLIFTITSGHWEKKCQLFDKRFSTGFQKSLSTCPGKPFEE